MKKVFLLLTFMLSFLQMKADEGMWLMMLVKRLNGTDLQKQGLHLTPEEIYSVNHSSLKDGIVQFGGGCTAEMVSGSLTVPALVDLSNLTVAVNDVTYELKYKDCALGDDIRITTNTPSPAANTITQIVNIK